MLAEMTENISESIFNKFHKTKFDEIKRKNKVTNEVKCELKKLKKLTKELDNKEEEILDLTDMYSNLFNSLWNGVIILENTNNEFIIKDINESAKLIDHIDETKKGKNISHIFTDESFFLYCYEKLEKVYEENIKEFCVLEKRNEDNQILYHYDCYIYKIRNNDIVILFENKTTEIIKEELNEKRVKLLNCSLIASNMLVNKEHDLKLILQKLIESTNTDGSFIFKNENEEKSILVDSYGENNINEIYFKDIPTVKEYLDNNHYICDTSINENSKDMTFYKKNNIKSFCKVSITINNELWGFLGLEETKYKKQWTFDDINILKNIADIIGEIIKHENGGI